MYPEIRTAEPASLIATAPDQEPHDLLDYLPIARTIPFCRKQVIYTGAPPALYCVVEGMVRVYTHDQRHRELHLGFYVDGDLFGETCALGSPETAEVALAMTSGSVMCWRPDVLRSQMKSKPEIAMLLADLVGARLTEMRGRLRLQLGCNGLARTALAFLDVARFGLQAKPGEVELPLWATDWMIATLVGTTREIITAHANNLIREKCCERRGRRRIVYTDRLSELAARECQKPRSRSWEARQQGGAR